MQNKKHTPHKVSNILLPLCFIVLYLLLDYFYQAIPDKTLRIYYHDYFISLCAFIINAIAPDDGIKVIQNSIISSKANLAIVRTCDGSMAFFLITSAILVFRATARLTVLGIFAGVLLVLLLNTIRIISLYFLMSYNINWFSYAHLTIAPFLILSTCCAYFSFWAYYANEVKRGGA